MAVEDASELPSDVAGWARARAGVEIVFEERTRPLAEARTWALCSRGAPVAWLKWHRSPGRAARERRAYEHWLVDLRDMSAPLWGVCPTTPDWLLTGHVAGAPMDALGLTAPETRAAYHNLGRALARLHAVPVERPGGDAPLTSAFVERADRWGRSAQRLGGFDGLDAVRDALGSPWPEALPCVPCHRDVQLHNTIVRWENGRLTTVLIDFGQARPDVWVVDVVKLFQLPSSAPHGVWDAFFDGYGRRLTGAERATFDRFRLLHGLGVWTWATSRGAGAEARAGGRVIADALRALR